MSGEQARQLGEYMRAAGAIDLLAELLDDPDPLLPQWILGTLANLCSDAFDPVRRAPRINRRHPSTPALRPRGTPLDDHPPYPSLIPFA